MSKPCGNTVHSAVSHTEMQARLVLYVRTLSCYSLHDHVTTNACVNGKILDLLHTYVIHGGKLVEYDMCLYNLTHYLLCTPIYFHLHASDIV